MDAPRDPASERKKLTEITVKQLRAPAEGRRIVWDTEERGFGIRIAAALPGCPAHSVYVVTYRLNGRRVMETIGDVDKIKVADARKRARRSRAFARDGKDPHAP